MTREERLELLKQIEKDIHVCSLESTFLEDAKSCAIHSAIEELEQEPRWIPVSERLPKELWGVLVYCPTNDNIFCAYLEKGVWKIFSPEALEEIKEIVTAWMPLPKAYREVEE